MTTAVTTEPDKNDEIDVAIEDALENSGGVDIENEPTDTDLDNAYDIIENDNGMFINDIALEAEVTSFIDHYQSKEFHDLEKPAVVLSKLRILYNAYSAKIEKSGSITKGVLTKYGIRRGMLLNIEKRLLEQNGQQWLIHYAREYGEKSLRTAQDYMALANTPKIIRYAVIGKERLMGILRAIRILEIKSDDPICTLFQQCGISFNPEDSHIEEKLVDLKLGIDNAVAMSKIKKAEEKKDVVLEVNLDHIKNLIDGGLSVNGQFIDDLFEIKSEGRDVNSHLEGLCGESGDGDEMLPHIKRATALPKLVEGLKSTVESIRQHNSLVRRVEQDDINDLERYVAELKNLFENQNPND